jgi:hypothetical protein
MSIVHLSYAFYMCNTAYKKQGLPIDVSCSSILYFLHAQHRIQKAKGSRLISLNNEHLVLFILTNIVDPY